MAENNALEQKRVFAEEAAVVNAQTLLHSVMERKNISRADLAREMNVSRARVSQIFSDECSNFTIRLLARALHALGEDLVMMTDREFHEIKETETLSSSFALGARDQVNWTEIQDYAACLEVETANDNIFESFNEVRTGRSAYEEMAA